MNFKEQFALSSWQSYSLNLHNLTDWPRILLLLKAFEDEETAHGLLCSKIFSRRLVRTRR
jgi:hypothetical protein